jgi:hypothetical protein
MPLGNVRRDGHRRPPQLRRKSESLLDGKHFSNPIRFDDEVHGHLPDNEIAVAEDRHEGVVEGVVESAG